VDGVAAAAAEGGVPPVRRRLVAEFLVIMAGLLGSVVVLEEAVGIDIVHLVPLVGVAAAVALSFFLDGGLAAVGRLAGEYGRDGLLARHREMALVQSAGFLVGSLRLSGLGGAGLDFLRRSLPDTPLGLAPWLAVLILVLGFVGFPPIPATLMVVASVDPATFGDAPAYFALSLVVGTSVSLLLAPFSIPVVVLSAATGREAREFGFRANWLYGAGLLVVGQAVLWLLHSRTGIV
ncbi:MAG: hypothetical protein IRY95_06045, partial [Clostridia bacterium]|nr:hypothetical protein [Clostridia bacterium]